MNKNQLLLQGSFTRQEYYRTVAEGSGKISEDALAYSLRKDLSEGRILRVGWNRYSFQGSKKIYTHTYSDEACDVAGKIITEYPDAEFQIFELVQLNEFVNHLYAHNTIFLFVENDLIDYVFDSLRQPCFGRLMIKPDITDYYRYLADDQVVLLRLPSGSPRGNQEKWQSRIEKILVDITVDKLVSNIIPESEFETVFREASERYFIDAKTMFSYARRKGATVKLKQVLQKYAAFLMEKA